MRAGGRGRRRARMHPPLRPGDSHGVGDDVLGSAVRRGSKGSLLASKPGSRLGRQRGEHHDAIHISPDSLGPATMLLVVTPIPRPPGNENLQYVVQFLE
jgi:hypothetical protein